MLRLSLVVFDKTARDGGAAAFKTNVAEERVGGGEAIFQPLVMDPRKAAEMTRSSRALLHSHYY